jgi:3-phenylpropionate/trans-cinnamate dioxygenase ferredoxin reductase subunit
VADVGVLIVGGGVAGAACAEQLREDGYDGSIVLCGREPDPPYNRPPVTKGYLLGEESREDALVHPADWWAQRDVDVRTRVSVMKLDAAARKATLSTRDELSFEHALLATGANVRRRRSTARTSRASTTCARCATPMSCATTPPTPSTSCWSAARSWVPRRRPR